MTHANLLLALSLTSLWLTDSFGLFRHTIDLTRDKLKNGKLRQNFNENCYKKFVSSTNYTGQISHELYLAFLFG